MKRNENSFACVNARVNVHFARERARNSLQLLYVTARRYLQFILSTPSSPFTKAISIRIFVGAENTTKKQPRLFIPDTTDTRARASHYFFMLDSSCSSVRCQKRLGFCSRHTTNIYMKAIPKLHCPPSRIDDVESRKIYTNGCKDARSM